MGIGTVKDVAEARAWYRAAAEHGDKRANQRLAALGGQPVPQANELADTGAGQHGRMLMGGPPQPQAGRLGQAGPAGAPHMRPMAMTAKEQGQRVAAEQAQRIAIQAEQARQQQAYPTQPTSAPFPSAIERSTMSPSANVGPSSYPTPMAMKESQTAQREHAFQMAVQQQQQHRMRGSPAQSAASSQRVPYGADMAHSQQQQQYYQQQQQQQQYQQQRLPPGSAGYPPGSMPYPSYPNQMSEGHSAGSPPMSAGSPLSAAPSEKKKSLWTQLKHI